jgi:Domain of unknown function (DUF1994).
MSGALSIAEFNKEINNNFQEYNEQEPNVFRDIISEYEKVVVKSIITSFGLDFLLFNDRRGGDVDTIHTARDGSVTDYANKKNQSDYDNHGEYDKKMSGKYHSSELYKTKNAKVSEAKKNGNLDDAYTGKRVKRNADMDLDHEISAKEIHDDPGRILAELDGIELANADSNLNPTDRSINRSMGKKTITEFIDYLEKTKDERANKINELRNKSNLSDKERKELNKLEKLDEIDINKLKKADKKARAEYEGKINSYYTSKKFMKDVANASLKSGAKLGLRQALGTIFMELWITIREDMPRVIEQLKDNLELGKLFNELGEILKKAFERIKIRYKEIISSFKDGAIAGILSTISATIINIFFTTAKFIGRILRTSWASIVEAIKIIVLNPDNLGYGDQIKAVTKIVSTCIAVICGSLIEEAITNAIPVIPIVSEVLPTFIGTMVTGIMSVSFIYFIDNSKTVKKIVDFLNQFTDKIELALQYYKEANRVLNNYVAKLVSIDIESFEKEIENIQEINVMLNNTTNEDELSDTLYKILSKRGIKLQFTNFEEFDDFMKDKDSILII